VRSQGSKIPEVVKWSNVKPRPWLHEKKTIIEIHEQNCVTKVGRSGLCCGASFLQVPGYVQRLVTGYG